MQPINELIFTQRQLLLSKGYTEHMLHVPNQPAFFLLTLRTKLLELDRENRGQSIPQVFTHRLPADFENGSFPAYLDFNYEYDVNKKSLTLLAMKATLFDIEINQSLKKKDPSLLIPAKDLLKSLKERLRFYKSVKDVLKKTPAKAVRKRL